MKQAGIIIKTNEMHRGAFINALDEPTVHDHYELFGLIYGFAAKRALARASEDLPQQLGEIQSQFAKATTAAGFTSPPIPTGPMTAAAIAGRSSRASTRGV